MFTDQDFTVFDVPTLTGRLAQIRSQLDPKFEQVGASLQTTLTEAGLPALTLHVAKHLRRHKNPPPNTWLALAPSTRGYKMTPHLEVGLWDDRLFVWVAVLQEAKRAEVKVPFDTLRTLASRLPTDSELASDHTKKAVLPLDLNNFDLLARRYQTQAKAEFLVGKTYLRGDPLFADPEELWADIQTRVLRLAPYFQALLKANASKKQ